VAAGTTPSERYLDSAAARLAQKANIDKTAWCLPAGTGWWGGRLAL
jgi:hypothetical protein